MVESSRGNTLRRHWRDQSQQCGGDHQSRSGFYRRLVRGVGSSRWARRSGRAAIPLMLGIFLNSASFAQANDPILSPSEIQNLPTISASTAQSSFDTALNAYELMDYVTALTHAKVAAAQGHAEAQVMTAHILTTGDAGIKDDAMAADMYRKAALQKNVDAYMGLGGMAMRSQAGLTPSDAMQWFSAAAQTGRRDAMRAIGEMYLKGQGIPPNPEKAKHWLDKASQNGDVLADRKMADSLFESDPVKALEHYEKAAAAGDNEAAYIAAVMYEENLNVRPNTNRMAALLKQAAESGHPPAQADYGLLAYQGRGVTQNIATAAEWFKKSAVGGDSEGRFLYAFILAKGEGIQQNFEEAYYWLLKSGDSTVSTYNQDRIKLRERLEQNVERSVLDRARARLKSE